MEFVNEFIQEYGFQIIYAILTAAGALIGAAISKAYRKWVNTREKKELAKIAVTAVEQIYQNLHGEEKFAKAYEALSEMLEEHGIKITSLEIKMLIEAAVGEANKAFERANAAAEEELDEEHFGEDEQDGNGEPEPDEAQISLEEVM